MFSPHGGTVGCRRSDAPRFSLVIPAHNEAAFLPRLLDSVEAARSVTTAGAIEVVVADNGSTDATAAIAEQRGCIVAKVEKRVIAAARNGGAATAHGEILCFTDADGRIHPQTFNAIGAAADAGRAVAGATGLTMERWSAGLIATYVLMLPLVWLTKMDSGVVWCRRADFLVVGGYDEDRRVAEDVAFLLALRRHGRRDGRKLERVHGAKVIGSVRKFDEHGDWHYFTQMPRVALRMLARPAARDEFVERYWYRTKR